MLEHTCALLTFYQVNDVIIPRRIFRHVHVVVGFPRVHVDRAAALRCQRELVQH